MPNGRIEKTVELAAQNIKAKDREFIHKNKCGDVDQSV